MENRSCYGQAFRQLRLDRGYSLKEAAGNIISPQMLGVFEHGKSGISLNNFGRLLIRIGATWNDFFRYYNGESILKELSLSDEILVKINNGHYYDGFKLVESSYQSYFQTLSLTSKLTDDELEIVLNYLNRIDTWGIFEYSVLSYILADCPYEMVKYRSGKILDAMANNKKSFLSSKKEDIAILIHMIGYFSRKAYFKDANKLIAELENILKSPSYNHLYTEKFNFKFYQAMNFLRQNNPKGLEIARDCIRFLEAFEALDNSNASAIDKNKILSAVSVLNKTGIPFKES